MITIRLFKAGTKVLLLLIALISIAAFAYAHDAQYDDRNHTFRSGYMAGFEHGYADQQARTDFDFRHARQYQTRSRDGRSNDSRQDLNFRLGYVEGYADGYFRRDRLFDFQQNHGSTGHYQYNNQGHLPDQGTIIVFTDTGYSGYSREFSIGQYPSLEGKLDDDIQSVRLNGSVRVILFEDDKFRGKSIILDRDSRDLREFRDKTGSMIIERARYGYVR